MIIQLYTPPTPSRDCTVISHALASTEHRGLRDGAVPAHMVVVQGHSTSYRGSSNGVVGVQPQKKQLLLSNCVQAAQDDTRIRVGQRDKNSSSGLWGFFNVPDPQTAESGRLLYWPDSEATGLITGSPTWPSSSRMLS